MIDGIRHRFAKSIEKDPWDADQEMVPEVEEASEPSTDIPVLLADMPVAPGFSPGGGNIANYYKSVIGTAIKNGGRYGGLQIPVPWLRVILAGLESRYIDPDTMWYEVDAESPVNPLPDIPPYDALFPSDGNVLPGPGQAPAES